MTQPRGWWFESRGEQCDLKEFVVITRLLLVLLTFSATGYNFIDFLHVKYKKKRNSGSHWWRVLSVSRIPHKSEYLCGGFM